MANATEKQLAALAAKLGCKPYLSDVGKKVEALLGERCTGIGRYLTQDQASRALTKLGVGSSTPAAVRAARRAAPNSPRPYPDDTWGHDGDMGQAL